MPDDSVAPLSVPITEPIRAAAPAASRADHPGIEARIARLEADVGNIRSRYSDIKEILRHLEPRIYEMYGTLTYLATKEDISKLRTEMDRRPVWPWITTGIGVLALLASFPVWPQWLALFKELF
jgi:hypothetical protein